MLRTALACGGLAAGLAFSMIWLNGAELTTQQWLALPSVERGLQVTLVCVAGLAGYLAILLLLGVRPRHFLQAPQHAAQNSTNDPFP
jgi:protein-S-isoprenylcysteine O-methyltransferase Ste14